MELYYPVQIFKAPSCGVGNQRINKNKRDLNKKRNRVKSEGRSSEEITKNMCAKCLYFHALTTPVKG
jgi:hypothetical protein